MQTSTLFAVLEFQFRGLEFMVGGIVLMEPLLAQRTIVYSVQRHECMLQCFHQKAASGSKCTDPPSHEVFKRLRQTNTTQSRLYEKRLKQSHQNQQGAKLQKLASRRDWSRRRNLNEDASTGKGNKASA